MGLRRQRRHGHANRIAHELQAGLLCVLVPLILISQLRTKRLLQPLAVWPNVLLELGPLRFATGEVGVEDACSGNRQEVLIRDGACLHEAVVDKLLQQVAASTCDLGLAQRLLFRDVLAVDEILRAQLLPRIGELGKDLSRDGICLFGRQAGRLCCTFGQQGVVDRATGGLCGATSAYFCWRGENHGNDQTMQVMLELELNCALTDMVSYLLEQAIVLVPEDALASSGVLCCCSFPTLEKNAPRAPACKNPLTSP